MTSPEGIEPAIAAFHEVYSASWKVPEPYGDSPSLIHRLASIGMLRLGIAHLRGRPVAAQLWIVGQEKALYKVAYHKAFASFSPGTVLTSHLMQHVIDHDHVKEVDFLIGDDEYKPFWMTDRRERWYCRLQPPYAAWLYIARERNFRAHCKEADGNNQTICIETTTIQN